MKKIKTIRDCAIISGVVLLLVALIVPQKAVFGSVVDWFCQHTAFADYFRTRFYDTHQLFPNFALALGGGENIYYYSYYGLFNPVLLVSFLLPKVSMAAYMMVTSVLLVIAGGILLYLWLKHRGISPGIALFTALLYATAAPVIFHSHRHVMFVNYLPFLILALWGVDRHFDQQKSGLLCVATLLVILCSFYYSIGGIMVLVLYGVYRYFSSEEKKSVASFFKIGIRFLIPIFLAVMLSAVLLVPTFAALMSGRSAGSAKSAYTLAKLLCPKLSTRTIVGSAYAIGMSATALVMLGYFLCGGSRSMRILSISMIVIFSIPLFSYVLNGGLYLRDKVFIGFLPLLCFCLAEFFTDIFEKPFSKKKAIYLGISVLLAAGAIVFGKVPRSKMPLVLAELLVFAVSYGLYRFCKKPIVCALPVFLCSACLCYTYNGREQYVEKGLYQKVVSFQNTDLLNNVLAKESHVYRTANLFELRDTMNRVYTPGQNLTSTYSSSYQPEYRNFADRILENERPKRNRLMNAASQNPFYLRLLGVKYVLGNEAPNGYHMVKKGGDMAVYENDKVLPLGYVTDQLMSTKQLKSLSYPYRGEYLQNYAAVKGGPSVTMTSQLQSLNFEWPDISKEGFSLKRTEQGYAISAKQEHTIEVDCGAFEPNDIIFVQMNVEPERKKHKDICIRINHVENTRTDDSALYANQNKVFHFAVSNSEGLKKLFITFGKGNYTISHVQAWRINEEGIGQNAHNLGVWQLDKTQTKGDVLQGSITVQKDGLFVSSIPYSKGFTVLVDGKETALKKVNTAFVGFSIFKGKHQVKFVYRAPGQRTGLVISGVGVLLFAFLLAWEKRLRKFKQ